ncbi:MAG: hypothetical protein KIT73_15660 [Burkholderiales bacterium]|nr:hypothetical protein [Burkholderiales bacterium]
MILRLIIVLLVIGLIVLALTPRRSATDVATRRKALALAARKTAWSVATVGASLLCAFGWWHFWRHGDEAARWLGIAAAPAALACFWLALRADRQTLR